MGKKRSRPSAGFKAKVALSAVKEVKTISELSSEFGVHSTQIHRWKRQLLDGVEELFRSPSNGSGGKEQQAAQEAALYEQIGRLKMELEWLKKKAARFE